jgi:hypothetical protein
VFDRFLYSTLLTLAGWDSHESCGTVGCASFDVNSFA